MFKKYNSIENTYRTKFLEQIKWHGFSTKTFIVQEKVHGSNISFITENGIEFKTAKRSGLIEDNEAFFNYEKVLEDILPKLQLLWKSLIKNNTELKQLTIFGEIFGGSYPHNEVEKDKQSIRVQKGVFYSPLNHFYAFDVLINSETYLNVDLANFYFEKVGLLHAKTLFKGSIEDCLKYKNDFNTLIPSEFNLPPIEPNICEGVIIKPMETLFLNGGSRVILKNKNEKWSENKKFNKTIKPIEPPSEQVLKLQEAILTYVTENRLNNVISKMGVLTLKDFGKLLGQFNKDIIEDFTKDFENILTGLDKKEIKTINNSILNQSKILVKAYMFNL